MSAHTPGPWTLDYPWRNSRSPNGVRIVSGALAVCTITRHADKPLDQKQADALLIAAAPDLLQAAKDHLRLCTEDTWKALEAAVAKAETA